MSFTGVHVAVVTLGAQAIPDPIVLANPPVWSETMANPGVTARTVPSDPSNANPAQQPAFEVRASLDVFVAIGKAPDASQPSGTGDAARIFVPAGETRNLIGRAGQKLAWVAA